MLLIGVGCALVLTGIAHIARGEVMATQLGWPSGGPFQKVVGIWKIGVGLSAIANFWISGGFRIAVVMSTLVFWAGAGIMHARDVPSPSARSSDKILTAVAELIVAVSLVVLGLHSAQFAFPGIFGAY
jgi:heme A synthase